MRKTRTFVTRECPSSLYMVLAVLTQGTIEHSIYRTNALVETAIMTTRKTIEQVFFSCPMPATAQTRTNVHLSDIRQSNQNACASQGSTRVNRGQAGEQCEQREHLSSAAIVKNFTILVDHTCGSSARAARDFSNI